jgi:hypothetical protein
MKAFETQEPKWKAIVVDIEAGRVKGRIRNRETEVVRVSDEIVIVPPDAGHTRVAALSYKCIVMELWRNAETIGGRVVGADYAAGVREIGRKINGNDTCVRERRPGESEA